MNLDWYNLILPTLLSLSGYFITRAIARVDSLYKNLTDLQQEIGQQKMINEAQWRIIDDLKDRIREVERS
jgi:cell division protein FtsB